MILLVCNEYCKKFFFLILFRLIDIYLFGAIFIGLCERKKSAVYEIYE